MSRGLADQPPYKCDQIEFLVPTNAKCSDSEHARTDSFCTPPPPYSKELSDLNRNNDTSKITIDFKTIKLN